MSYAAIIGNKTGTRTRIERIRLILGFSMMIFGFYFGLFSTGPGEGLGLLTIILSPFVMLTDK